MDDVDVGVCDNTHSKIVVHGWDVMAAQRIQHINWQQGKCGNHQSKF